MTQARRIPRIEQRHHISPPAKRPETHPSPDPFPQRHQVRPDVQFVAQAAVRQPRGHDFVEDQQRARRRGRLAQVG